MGDVIKGPWKDTGAQPNPAKPAFVWRSKHPSTVEERRAAILAARPRCRVCEVPFAVNVHVPGDGVCAPCRRDIDRAGLEPDDPSLF